jgi:hypothetical protein
MIDYKAIAQTAAVEADLTKVATFVERVPLVEGACRLRLREYIELGMHAGSAKFPKPKEKAKLVFEVVSKKHLEKDSEGKTMHREIVVFMNKGLSAKAGDKKIFNSMNTSLGSVYTHFAEMIGKGFAAKITNSVPAEVGGAVYSNLDEGPKDARTYTFVPPFKLDEDGEFELTEDGAKVDIPMPELRGTPRLFLWELDALTDAQVVEMWESLYIDGVWEAKEAADGKAAQPERSKNVLQDKIMSNLAWEGSRTEGLTQTFVELDELTGEPAEEEEPTKASTKLDELANMKPAATDPSDEPAKPVAEIVDIPGLED